MVATVAALAAFPAFGLLPDHGSGADVQVRVLSRVPDMLLPAQFRVVGDAAMSDARRW